VEHNKGGEMKFVEISGLIEQGMWNYDDELGEEIFAGPKIQELATVEKNGFSAHRIGLSILTSTYLETGAHLMKNVKTIDKVGIDELFLPAAVMKLKTKKPKSHITKKDLVDTGIPVKKR